MAMLALVAVILIGFDARVTELAFDDWSRCRAAARWGAESAVARGRAQLARGTARPLSGELPDDVTYTLRVETRPDPKGAVWTLTGAGVCQTGAKTLRRTVVTEVQRQGRRWIVLFHAEPPHDP